MLMKSLKTWPSFAALILLPLFLAGCGGGSEEESAATDASSEETTTETASTAEETSAPAKSTKDNTEEVNAYYKEHSDFFVTATPQDIPADLEWRDGMEYDEIGSPDAKKGGTWHQYEMDFPRTLRKIGPDANGSFRFWQTDILIPFARRHPNEVAPDAYIPGVAKEWALDPENATVYMKIDPDARWSDGEKITTEDVFFTFYFHQSKYNNAPWYQDHYTNQYKNVTVYDDLTFSITTATKKPDYHQYCLLIPPTPRHFYYNYGEDFVQRYQWTPEPTTGPYVFLEKDIQKGKSIALTRNKDWWAKDKKYYKNIYNPDRIEFTVIRDPEKAFETFKAGALDSMMLNLAKRWFDQLPDDHPLVKDGYIHKAVFFNKVPQGGFNLWFNTSQPLLDNVDIRRGIAHSCNWDLIIDQVFRNLWARMHGTGLGYGEADHPDILNRDFNIEKAGEYFAKAGFTKRGPDGILVNDKGQRLSFTITTGYKTLQDHLTVLEREARKAGVEFKLEILEPTTAWKKTQEKKHEISLSGFSFGVDEIYSDYWQGYHGDNAYKEDGSVKTQTNNLVMINDPVLDGLIIKYRESEDHSEKVRLAHQIEEVLFDQAVHAYGFYLPSYRVGYWRWVKWPEDFNVMRSEYYYSWMVHWIDEDARKETLDAMRKKQTFPASVVEYDKYK